MVVRRRESPGSAPFGVRVTDADADSPDAIGTTILLNAYSDRQGFHCPWCQDTITDEEQAIRHLADEINRAFQDFSKGVR